MGVPLNFYKKKYRLSCLNLSQESIFSDSLIRALIGFREDLKTDGKAGTDFDFIFEVVEHDVEFVLRSWSHCVPD